MHTHPLLRFRPATASALLALSAVPFLRAAEALYIIDAGAVTSVDTATGAVVNTFQDPGPPLGPGGIAFTSRDTLYTGQQLAGAGNRAEIYTASGAHGWTKSGEVWQGSSGNLKILRGIALQKNGLLLAIGQNSHDLWALQSINYLASITAGKVRSYLPLQFPYHIAASPIADTYATSFYNGTLLVTRGGVDAPTTTFSGTEGICFDYTGLPVTDPGTGITTTHGLLYISNGNGNTIRRYDAETMQPWGQPGNRTNPVLVNGADSGMTGMDRLAVDAATGTLYCMGRHQNNRDAFNYQDIVMAGFSTVDGTARGLGGSTTDPVVYHRPWGNAIRGFAIRPGYQVQQYNVGTHTLNGNVTFADPGKLLSLVNTGTGEAVVTLTNGLQAGAVEFGGLNRISSAFSAGMKAISQIGSITSMISALIRKSGTLQVTATSTVNASAGVSATEGGALEVDAGGTLNCPGGTVDIGPSSRLRAGGLIAAQSLRAASGAVIAPGASPGTMTVQGNLDLLAGSVLEIEIAGTVPGVSHDVVTVQNAAYAALNGNLVPQLTGGFTPQASDTFAVLNANLALTGTIQNLNAGRVSTANGRGSFALTFINGGTGIQLSDYQIVPALQAWRNLYFTPAQQADTNVSGHDADPDGDGLKNIVEFALNANPLNGAAPAGLPRGTTAAGGATAFTFTRMAGGTTTSAGYDVEGIRCLIEHSPALNSWNALTASSPEVASWTVTPAGDGVMENVSVVLAPAAGARRQLRMSVTLP